MRRMTVSAIAAALCFVGGLSAQEKPNFSGEWTLTAPLARTAAVGPGEMIRSLCSRQCTVTQDATSLTIMARMNPAVERKLTFSWDGERKFGVAGRPELGEVVYGAMWDGNKLRISIQVTGSAVTETRRPAELVFSMNAGQMEVESSITFSGGEVGRGKETYKRN